MLNQPQVPLAWQRCVGAAECFGSIVNAYVAHTILLGSPMPPWELVKISVFYTTVISMLPLLVLAPTERRLRLKYVQQQREQMLEPRVLGCGPLPRKVPPSSPDCPLSPCPVSAALLQLYSHRLLC